MATKAQIPLVDDSDDFDNPQPGYRVVWNACGKALMQALVFFRSGGVWVVGGYGFLLAAVVGLWQQVSPKLTRRNKIIILSAGAVLLAAAAVTAVFIKSGNKNTVDKVDAVDFVVANDTPQNTTTPTPPPDNLWGTASVPSYEPVAVPNLFTAPAEPPPLTPSRSAFDIAVTEPVIKTVAPPVPPPVVEQIAPPVAAIVPAAPPAMSSLPSLPVIATSEALAPIVSPIIAPIAEPFVAVVPPPSVPIVEESASLFPLPPPSDDTPMIAMLATHAAAPVAELVAPAEPFAPLFPPATIVPVSRELLDTSLHGTIEPTTLAAVEPTHLPEDSPLVPEDPPLPIPFAEETTDLTALLPSNVSVVPVNTALASAPPPAIIAAPLPKIGEESPVIVETRNAASQNTALLTSFAPILPPGSEPISSTPHPGTLYRAQPGDNWWNIAQRAYGSGTAFRNLAEYNKQRVTDLTQIEGTVIELPPMTALGFASTQTVASSPAITPARIPPLSPLPGTTIYIVRDGETLQSIAETKLGSRSRDTELARLNTDRLSSTIPLTAGMEILIPLSTGTQRSATAAYTRR